MGTFNISKDNYEKIKKLKCEIDPQKSSYLGNCNDYKISEADNRDKNKEFNHLRKTFVKTSFITGVKREVNIPPIRNDRWGSFCENFLLLTERNQGLRRKGGLFTEFTNKNIGSIIVNINDIKERMKKEKEKEKEKNL